MKQILLNNLQFNLISFNRNTNLNNENISSNAYFTLVGNAGNVHSLWQTPITSLIIKNSDDEVIYDAGEIDAYLNSIDEVLNEETMNINVNILFNINNE